MSQSVSLSYVKLFLVLITVLLVPTLAVAEPKEVTGKVTHVTLYRGQALVTRAIELEGKKGSLEILVGALPEQIVQGSLFAEGGEHLQVRAVRFRTRAVGEEPREEVRKIDEAMEELAQQILLNNKNLELLSKRSAYLDSLEGFVAPTAKVELSKGVLDAEALQQITKFSFDQRKEIVEEQIKLAKESSDLNKKLTLLQRQRAELTAGASKTVREAVLFVEKLAEGKQTLRLNYLVGNCGWMPSYTFRADNGKEVNVEYNALIQQISGESWSDVSLTLSTASPALSSAGPGLAPFSVVLASPSEKKPQAANQQKDLLSQLRSIRSSQHAAIEQGRNAMNFRENTDSGWAANSAANDYQQLELTGGKYLLSSLRSRDLPQNDGPSLSYQLQGTVSLSSRSDQQMVRIMQTAFKSRFYHIATPVLTSYVYREAELANDSDVDLLAGQMSVYLEGRFVGRGEIPTVARGESFVVGFGADPQLRARRELADKDESVQGGNRELQFEYRLVIENFKQEPVTLRVFDRLPHSQRDSEVRVTLGEMSDELSTDKLYLRRERPKGILRWDIEVPASATAAEARLIEYQYKVEHDRQFLLTTPRSNQQQQQEYENLQRGRAKL